MNKPAEYDILVLQRIQEDTALQASCFVSTGAKHSGVVTASIAVGNPTTTAYTQFSKHRGMISFYIALLRPPPC